MYSIYCCYIFLYCGLDVYSLVVPVTQEVTSGKPALFRCLCDPQSEIKWTLNDEPIVFRTYIKQVLYYNYLVLLETNKSYIGLYSCHARIYDISYNQSGTLIVVEGNKVGFIVA